MKKLLDREPTPEMVEAMKSIHTTLAISDLVGIFKLAQDAAPALPEPGEVEQNIRFIAEQLLPKGLTPFHDRIIEAADLIAAQEAEILSVGESLAIEVFKREKAEAEVAVLKQERNEATAQLTREKLDILERAEKAEAERQEALNQRDAEKHAHDAELIRHYEEKYRLMGENERLTKINNALKKLIDTAKANGSIVVVIDAAKEKPKSDADILPVYFESRNP